MDALDDVMDDSVAEVRGQPGEWVNALEILNACLDMS
jgi:hypothetical protein